MRSKRVLLWSMSSECTERIFPRVLLFDDTIVATSKKSLPFTAVPVMLNHTARVLDAMTGKELDKINIAEIKKVSKPAAKTLLRLNAVTGQQNTRSGSRNSCRRGRTQDVHCE